MAHIATTDVQPWFETTKMAISSLDADRESQISSQVFGRLALVFPTEVLTWIDTNTTPQLVKSIISMLYAGWLYDTTYSENPDDNGYADRLRANAQTLIDGIVEGTTILTDVPSAPDVSAPEFFPTDASTAACPTDDNPSDGPMKFTMGKVF